jgi:hypothetical protein
MLGDQGRSVALISYVRPKLSRNFIDRRQCVCSVLLLDSAHESDMPPRTTPGYDCRPTIHGNVDAVVPRGHRRRTTSVAMDGA